jgi:hypoxanthine phosphoribosyltransferase
MAEAEGETWPRGQAVQELAALISREALAQRVAELGQQISADYGGKSLLVVGVLKGAWVFMADLVRQLRVPVRCDFVLLSSYGLGTQSRGEVTLRLDLTLPVQGQDVLIVEDLVDTGTTIPWLFRHLEQKQPASLRLCALLDKPTRRRVPVTIDYLGFTIPDHFVVGYGIDAAERYRELDHIARVLNL